MYGFLDMGRDRQNNFSIWTIFCPIKVENQNFEIVKKTPGDIILQMCTINYNHIMYGS